MVTDLTEFVIEGNIQEMPKAQAPIALPSLLKGFSKSQYEAGAKMGFPEEGVVSS